VAAMRAISEAVNAADDTKEVDVTLKQAELVAAFQEVLPLLSKAHVMEEYLAFEQQRHQQLDGSPVTHGVFCSDDFL